MLKVILEVHPFGDAETKYTIGEYNIGNMGRTDNEDECLYHCFKPGDRKNFIEVRHFRSHGAEELVRKFLEKLNEN